MKNKQIGVAVIGAGRIGTLRAHMAARHPSVRFLAVSDKDPARASVLAESVAANFSSGNNEEVISRPEVDAVFVSTPEHEHAEPILQALRLRKPVFVEKPIALSLEDADRIVAAAEEAGVDVRIGYSRRHDRRWMLAKEQVVRGRLGRILGATARVYNTRAQMLQILERSPEATPVLDVLTYYVDMACWFLEGVRP
ncbi:MAG: Gfo/Idh/MocA family oxidoreductase, partial [Candidatus Tectomicrobia bacterium]|nr:Gfo/Idh/MocA family oxidoreductase [Candidatus Tectomicrobia bacterium]